MKLEIIRKAYQFFTDSLNREICEIANIAEDRLAHICPASNTPERQVYDECHELYAEQLELAPSIADRVCISFWDSLVASLPN
ncbi:MAG: hypothetical protein IJZ39_12215 [Oscillospiraceae bacterium]|nr:hypothetical protein [Oscillospiraceae bacterium]